MNHVGTQTIKTDRLILRRFSPDDAEHMYRNWASDPEVTRFLSWAPHQSVEETREILRGWHALYANPAYYHWAIEYEGYPIGGIAVVRQSDANECATIGYCIGTAFWRKGIMPEAARAVIDYLFDEVGVHRVEISHAVKNPASGRVAEKCGLTCEGTLRENTKLRDGTFTDVRLWAILRQDRQARRTSCTQTSSH